VADTHVLALPAFGSTFIKPAPPTPWPWSTRCSKGTTPMTAPCISKEPKACGNGGRVWGFFMIHARQY